MAAALPPPPASVAQPLAPGQRRACLSSKPDRKLFVVIGKLEQDGPLSTAHVTVLDETAGAVLPQIAHAPFDSATLLASCPRVVGPGRVSPEFPGGYRQWREAKGGVFTISVEQAFDISTQMALSAGGEAPR